MLGKVFEGYKSMLLIFLKNGIYDDFWYVIKIFYSLGILLWIGLIGIMLIFNYRVVVWIIKKKY